jgi:AcrR family transcriptional regulator
MAVAKREPERTASGRRKVPLGVREGGDEWERIHGVLAVTALEVLAERGYADMVMDDVSERAGMSKRTVYRHYPTKLDLAIAAIRKLPTFAGWTDGQDPVVNRVRRMSEIGAAHHPYFAPVLATVVVHRHSVPELLKTMRKYVLEPRERVVRQLIEDGQRRGEIRKEIDPVLAAAMITGQLMDDLTGMHRLPKGAKRGQFALEKTWPMLKA